MKIKNRDINYPGPAVAQPATFIPPAAGTGPGGLPLTSTNPPYTSERVQETGVSIDQLREMSRSLLSPPTKLDYSKVEPKENGHSPSKVESEGNENSLSKAVNKAAGRIVQSEKDLQKVTTFLEMLLQLVRLQYFFQYISQLLNHSNSNKN
jgi:hypothetical protein